MSTFTTRTAPWMTVGTVIEDEHVTAAQAAKLGGMDFEVQLKEVAYRSDSTFEPWKTDPDRFAVVATDNGDVFDYVSSGYRPVQYAEAFEFMDKVDPRYIAAGTLRDRKQGFMVVQAPEMPNMDLELLGESDPHELFAVLRTSHDRSRGLEVAIMALRGKCMNQLTMPTFAQSAPQRWSIRHVGNPQEKLHDARVVIDRMKGYADRYMSLAKEFAEQDLLVDEVSKLLERVLDDRPKRDDQKNAIIDAWQNSEQVGFAGTGWGLIQAVSEYFEWGRASGIRTAQSRFIGGLEGQTHKKVERTAVLLRTRRG